MLPLGRLPPVNPPLSDVTVWEIPLLFTQQTFCPAVMVAVLGLKVNEPVAVMVALAPELAQLAGGVPPPPPYGDVEVDPPHDTSSTAPAIPDTSDSHFDRINPPASHVGDVGRQDPPYYPPPTH